MRRPTRFALALAFTAVLATALVATGAFRGGVTPGVAKADDVLTGRALAKELNLELLPEIPNGCQNYVEVDDPAGYCIADIVQSEAESYRLGLMLRDMEVTDLDVEIFDVESQLASTPVGTDRWFELLAQLDALRGRAQAIG